MQNSKFLGVKALLLWLFVCLLPAWADVKVSQLQCEYLTNPLGIDVKLPRFTWKISDSRHTRGQKQTGYQVLVASSPTLLARNQGDIWDTGLIMSSQSALVPFAGNELTSGENCYWKVRILDRDRRSSPWSSIARFSMGLLEPADWTGSWIKHPTAPETDHIWFRKTFLLRERAASAFIYVASIGYHELYINGQRVGTQVLSPVLSRLDKRVLYVTYDITNALRVGKNCIAIWTGPGWSRFDSFNTKSALRVQLTGKTMGGNAISLASDTSWKCEISSSEDIGGCHDTDYGGEQVDARKDDSNWDAVNFNDVRWTPVAAAQMNPVLSAQMVEPSRVIEDIPAQTVSAAGNTYKVDLGKNFSGWVSVKMNNQSAGDIVTIQVSDNPDTVQACGQKSIYICKGTPAETFQNRFNYTGGRYVTITGLKNKPDLSDIVGHAIGIDLNRVGHFSCSNDLFNKIYETDLWTYRADTVEGYTQDCPHRERLGYGEENFATAWGCGLPNYEVGAFYTNDLRDWRDVQEVDGRTNFVAPQNNRTYGGPMWSSAPLNIGWEFYKTYGDKRILSDSYATDKAWLNFLGSNVSNGILQAYDQGGGFLGDWAEPYYPSDPLQGKEFGNTPEALLFNNCVYAMNLRTFVEIAKVLGNQADAEVYGKKLEDLKKNVQAHFFNASQNTYIDSRQIHLAFPMFADITPDNVKPAVLANFEKESLQTRPYFDMGSSGLPILLKFLVEDVQRNDILFEHLSKTTEPSYGYFLSRGETAWPEYWDDQCPSRMHTCYTGIASWFMKGLGGIREDPNQYGYQSFIIKPALVGDLTFVEADTESLYGKIISRWEKKNGWVQMNVTIPVNSTATVYVPATNINSIRESGIAIPGAYGVTFLKMEKPYAVFKVQSGSYQFVSR